MSWAAASGGSSPLDGVLRAEGRMGLACGCQVRPTLSVQACLGPASKRQSKLILRSRGCVSWQHLIWESSQIEPARLSSPRGVLLQQPGETTTQAQHTQNVTASLSSLAPIRIFSSSSSHSLSLQAVSAPISPLLRQHLAPTRADYPQRHNPLSSPQGGGCHDSRETWSSPGELTAQHNFRHIFRLL